MEWWGVFLFFLIGLMVLLVSGFPVAFSFLLIDMVGMIVFMGPESFNQVALQILSSVASFVLSPVPLFILMGELMFHSNIAFNTIDVLDKWLGRLPGRLGLLAAASGTIFAATSGSTMANTAMLGAVLLPEMRKRGYSVGMSVGPIIGVGGLAMLIPPSALAVVLASIGQISVGDLLMAGVIPGVALGAMFGLYIVLTAWIRPDLAPRYKVEDITLGMKLFLTVKYMVPIAFIIFMVIGLIILGIATPTEAAASGTIATAIVCIFYGKFNYEIVKKSLHGSLEITVMVFMIVAASKTFSSVLAFTGATNGMLAVVENLQVSPIYILIAMQIVVLILGCFMDAVSIMMICLPVFMPIANLLGFDPVWFGVLVLINLELGQLTPPFGMLLFVMKGVAPDDITIEDITKASVPYMMFDILIMILIIVFPPIAMWLPTAIK